MKKLLLIALLFTVGAVTELAANPIKTVGTSVVNKGAHLLEFRSGWSSDDKSPTHDGRFQLRQMYDYGLTDWYALRLTAIQDDVAGDGFEYHTTMLDNRVQVFEKNRDGFDGGFRLTYHLRDGDKKPDIAEMRWITQIPFNDYEFRHHIILQHQIGADSRSGVNPEMRWQFTAPVKNGHRAGVEMFNEFGNVQDENDFHKQMHDAGVVATGPLWNEAVRYQAGYRHGISRNAPDHAVKFFISYNF
jgi:hypothetical protein